MNTLATLVMAFAAAYFFLAVGSGVHHLRSRKIDLGFQSGVGYGRPFEPLPGAVPAVAQYTTYFLIPCLNEEAVIASTVGALRDPAGGCRVVVVDDGSDDATGELARAAGGDQVTVVRRELPLARQGKGAALNAGFRHVVADVAARGLDARRVIV